METAENGDITFTLDMMTPVAFKYAGDYRWWGKILPKMDEDNPVYSEEGIVAEKFSKLKCFTTG